MLKTSTAYLGLLWAAALLYVHTEGRMLASQQQGTKLPPLPLPTLTSSKDCGIPYALCGGSIPKGIECAKGPGWCQTGYFCGWVKVPLQTASGDKASTLRCLPVPEKCGTAGNVCCPSNAAAPHTDGNLENNVFRPPFCTDGSVCFSNSQHNNQDIYQGNEGSWPCMRMPKECGAAGQSCCLTSQMTWRMSTNPDEVKTQSNSRDKACDGDLVCKGGSWGVNLGTCG